MEFDFSVKTQRPELITKEEYPLFWWGNKNTTAPDNIGFCKVKVDGSNVFCNAVVNTGGIQHSTNDVVIAEFKPDNINAGKYEYGILLKTDDDDQEYVYGFCLT